MRLSALQKRIITEIANDIVNTLPCAEDLSCNVDHDLMRDSYISHKNLFTVCLSFWPCDDDEWARSWQDYNRPPKAYNTHKVSFSRSLRCLVDEKQLICAMALAWMTLGEGFPPEMYKWQGGGKMKKTFPFEVGGKTYHCLDSVPRYKLLSLTDEGWKVAREMLGDDKGRCNNDR